MYHGIPYGGFTVFKNDLNYFTSNKEYADRYHSPSASSIRGRYEPATKEETYEVYLNITKPFDINNKTDRDIFIYEEDKETRLAITKNAIRTAIFEREAGITGSQYNITKLKESARALERSIDYWDKKLLELEITASLVE